MRALRWVFPFFVLAANSANAQFSMPTSDEDVGHFYVTAYRDEGGQDWHCGGTFYSGHRGTDIGVGGFAGMDQGRDILAAMAGTVVTSSDGFFDRCSSGGCPGGGGCGNYVKLQHADGRYTMYCHMRQGTVAVSTGDTVVCGQKLGEVGSSGNSTGPHLHFEPRTPGNVAIEPFAGSCGASGTLWNEQGPYRGLPTVTCDMVSGPEPFIVDDQDPEFSFVVGAEPDAIDAEDGGHDGHFYYQDPYTTTVPLLRGRWRPDVPATGLYSLEFHVPNSPFAASQGALVDVAFQGGHSIVPIDLVANRGNWVSILNGQPFKFMEGVRNHVQLMNITGEEAGAFLAWDAVRWTWVGPVGTTASGGGCTLSNDCADGLVCMQGSCVQDCDSAGCDSGLSCEESTGACGDYNAGEDSYEPGPLWNPPPGRDLDGDGIPDSVEGMVDSDGDGIYDFVDTDSDGDGVLDADEGDGDRDNDGVPNYLDPDSDGDGISDGEEAAYPDAGDPVNPGDPADSDGDGDPDFLDPDSDNDGVPDVIEYGPEPQPDADGDGLPDWLDSDSDNDGIPDGIEAGEDPANPPDTDGDGTPDPFDTDSDGDGIYDGTEGTDDSDGDGVPDFQEEDSDGDGILDGVDEDRDGDGVRDLQVTEAPPIPESGCGCGGGGGAAGILAAVVLRRRRRRG